MIKYNSLDNAELQRLIEARDAKAFRVLYDRFWDKVFVICNNRVHDADIAQDLVQDIFLSIWDHKNITSIHNLEAYLFQATKFSVLKYLHKSSRMDVTDTNVFGIFDRIEEQDLSEALHSKVLRELLFQEVERLPERTKIIFNYSRNEHLNSREIAEKLNISPRTVENQIGNALKRLRNFLKNLNSFIIF